MSAVRKADSQRLNLVLGLGATGLSVGRYLYRNGCDAVFLDSRMEPPGLSALDEFWPDAKVLLGDCPLPAGIDRIIASPGIPDSHRLIKAAKRRKIEIISDIELFMHEASAPIVGVTGSNGKSTVTTLIYHMCRAAGRTAHAGGNLGEPALDLLTRETPEIYVLELSSFQLQRTTSLPAEVAVLLNVTADHLDWHADESEYRRAKYSIFREARAAVINRADPQSARAAKDVPRVTSFGLDAPRSGQLGMRREDGIDYLARGDMLLMATRELGMTGVHNYANALAALAAGELLGLELSAMLQVLNEFPGLPHRMQFIARKAAVDYYNDSKATNVAAAVAAIRSVPGFLVLIAGGDGKGSDFSELGTALEGKLRAAVLIGKDAERIAAALDTLAPVRFADDMQEAVSIAAASAESDDTVLLAPACASLDQYDSYAARGDAFRAAVEALN